MELISAPLIYLLGWCNSFLPNFTAAIVLFTLLTKVILFPVSLWVHKNGITMVRIMPELNRVKIDCFGDKDRIAEEQQALYKREHYHPLASTIPMFIQLILLIGVIGAVKDLLGTTDSLLSSVPAQLGGLSLLMPIAAGLSALILSLAQSKLNPLQREQGKLGQIGTSGFSVILSLVLGAYVPVGVGVYWICSNLFAILQQLILNAAVKPQKYIDYQALEESKREFAAMQALGGTAPKEDRQREKADYKQFFSIANKHLVFYSEKSGFYKYYQNVIEYLLARSNVVVHYVTSDPNDQIFTIAQSQPHIRPYYIGEKKLITLMMKMDADVVVMTVTSLDNYYLKRSYVRKDIEYVYIHHYPLSTTMIFNKGSFDHYDTILCTGEFQIEEIRQTEALYGLPPKKLISVGYCGLEQMQKKYETMAVPDRLHKKVLIAPSWHSQNIMDSCIDTVLAALLGKGYEIVVRPHPEYVKRYGSRMDAIVERYRDYKGGDLSFELDFSKADSLIDSDIVISDWSGAAYEFAYVTLKPVVFINTPPKVNNPEYDRIKAVPLELALRPQIGVQIEQSDIMDTLACSVSHLLTQQADYQPVIEAVRNRYVANYGTCAQVCGTYLLEAVMKSKSTMKGGAD